jgi:hypothetical protein
VIQKSNQSTRANGKKLHRTQRGFIHNAIPCQRHEIT